MIKTLLNNSLSKTLAVILIAMTFGMGGLKASHGGDEENSKWGKLTEENSDVIIHHVMDSHDWHITDIGETSIALHLPWIIYNSKTGMEFHGSTHSLVESGPNYLVHHDHVYYVEDNHHTVWEGLINDPAFESYEKDHEKYAILIDKYEQEHGDEKQIVQVAKVYEKIEGASLIDLSLTKTGLHIILISILMIWIFISVAKSYKKRDGLAPRGMQGLLEPIILFVREDVAKPYLHGKHDRFMPFLLTLFFFIWFSNLFGLTPFSSNITGNTSITIMLAFLSFVLIIKNSTMDFWMHILWFPGVPIWMKPLMLVVELMGFFTKPVALAIRLFANISAGHFMVLSLISLIFILSNNGESVAAGVGVMPLSIGFTIFIFAVELIVAAVQAFVFALLTAVFIGQAMESHGDDH